MTCEDYFCQSLETRKVTVLKIITCEERRGQMSYV